tara:strand:+ start:411 stop:548 length:138 start_codon:yes stop_codon:yes gene_type:complete
MGNESDYGIDVRERGERERQASNRESEAQPERDSANERRRETSNK